MRYSYEDQDSYYAMYRRACFAVTHKKVHVAAEEEYSQSLRMLGELRIHFAQHVAGHGRRRQPLAHPRERAEHQRAVSLQVERLKAPSRVEQLQGLAVQVLGLVRHDRVGDPWETVEERQAAARQDLERAHARPAAPDYQRCTLLHGLKALLGPACVDYPRLVHMYADYPSDPESMAKLYGRGMSYARLLGPEHESLREDIESRIRAREFDLVVYGSVHRGLPLHEVVASSYEPGRIVYVCGEEASLSGFAHACEHAGTYGCESFLFVREMHPDLGFVHREKNSNESSGGDEKKQCMS
jgi:hypothetical protein